MRSRDALVLAVAFVVLAVVAIGLTVGSSPGGGGMMGGMMGGSAGGMMVGYWIALAAFVVALLFVVLAVAGSAAPASPPPPPPPAVAPPPYTPAAASSPPSAPPPPVAVTSDVEVAIVRLLDEDERLLYTRLRDANGPVLQKDIVAWRTFSAAKVTRLLDRLEAKGLLVRERYGATNRIRLARQPSISGK